MMGPFVVCGTRNCCTIPGEKSAIPPFGAAFLIHSSSGSTKRARLDVQKASATLTTSNAGLRATNSAWMRGPSASVGKVVASTLMPVWLSKRRSISPSPVAPRMAGWVTQLITFV